MSEPRVLFITGEYPPMAGGIGDYTALLREALMAEGIASAVLAPDAALGADVFHARHWNWRTPRLVRRIARRTASTVVHIQYQAGAFAMHPVLNVLPWLLRHDIPVVTTYHDLRPPFLFPRAAGLRRFTMLRMARASAAVVVTNPGDAGALRKAGLAPVEVPIGPNLPLPTPGIRADAGTVAFFGFPSRSKGVADLIEALGLIDSTRRPRLVLIGASGTPAPTNDLLSVAAVDELATYHDVTIERTGFLSAQAASDALAKAGAIVLPFQRGASLRNGSLLAALQSGRPVVATRPSHSKLISPVAGMPQLILIPRSNPGRLWDGIETALTQARPVAPLPDAFAWPSIARQHRALYHALATSAAR